MLLNSIVVLLGIALFTGCVHSVRQSDSSNSIEDGTKVSGEDFVRNDVSFVRCTAKSQSEKYEIGDLVCAKSEIRVNREEVLKVVFVVLDKNSEDPYNYGFQELLRIRKGKIVERVKLRLPDDAYWSEVPLIRIRKQKYIDDLDGDGYPEFAVLPFHPGSAIWMTARIYSLKEKIKFWGTGRYQFEGDTFVQLNCPRCSKFNSEACRFCK